MLENEMRPRRAAFFLFIFFRPRCTGYAVSNFLYQSSLPRWRREQHDLSTFA